MRVVFDTNVLLSSTLWDRSVAQRLLFKLINTNSTIFSSLPIIAEYQKVLRRDFDYFEEDIIKIMEKVLSFITLIKPTQKVDIVKDDPDDNKIIECALASKSPYIITYDNHLLKFGKIMEIEIITPEQALKIL
jgi:uncharacterized protein